MTENKNDDGLDWSNVRAGLTECARALGEKLGQIDSLVDDYHDARGTLGLFEQHRRRLARERQESHRPTSATVEAVVPPVSSEPVTWHEDEDGRLVVSDGRYAATISAPRHMRLFLAVAECGGRSVPWRDILKRWAQEDGHPLTSEDTPRSYGGRLRRELGALGFRWQQTGTGAHFDASPKD